MDEGNLASEKSSNGKGPSWPVLGTSATFRIDGSKMRESHGRPSSLFAGESGLERAFCDVVYLICRTHRAHRWRLNDLPRLVIPPLRLGQAHLFYERGRPLAYVSWAWLSGIASDGFEDGSRLLKAEDWRSGENLWIVDLFAPFGHVGKISRFLREELSPLASTARSLRRDEDGTIVRIQHWRAKGDG